jgi:transcriptional regulator of arginine metabolism
MRTKTDRQSQLLELIRSTRITTQGELVAELRERGVDCTQASISRDIAELGLSKRGGRYVEPAPEEDLPDADDLAAKIGAFLRHSVMVGGNLVVIHTLSGTANSVAVYLDHRDLPGLAGTVAGDDTIFAAVVDLQAGEALVREMERIREAFS